ncbi:MAG TPA: peptidoglycan-binding domain-containing protein, partial [Candidatus Polarisedimenticolia bacterium]|nr:peptidoglycan-binding domain-containing protein [Candidatus Polarisedimenticolia bacterium]
MTRTRSRGWVGWMAVSFMAVALAGPTAAANRSVRSGPIYSSAGAIEWAQTVLQANGWLAKGAYTPGRDDRATLQAIREFQREHYLRATGMLDPETV